VKAALSKARAAVDREVRYAKARAEADVAADNGEHGNAAKLYEQAWTVIPARVDNGMQAVSALLLENDTSRAASVLGKLQQSGDANLSKLSAAMLSELKAIEPAAAQVSGDGRQFFADAGSVDAVRVNPMLPPIDRKPLETLLRPMPKLVRDDDSVTLLASLSADPAEAGRAFLPALPESRVAGDQPWREVLALTRQVAAPPAALAERALESAIVSEARTARTLTVRSMPAGAEVFVGERPVSSCRTPCEMRVDAGTHRLKAVLDGYASQEISAQVTTKGGEADFTLLPARGYVSVETGSPGTLKVNGAALNVQGPVELALLPGLHRIEAESGTSTQVRMLNVKAGARLRLRFQ
jgi:hypothetical protein